VFKNICVSAVAACALALVAYAWPPEVSDTHVFAMQTRGSYLGVGVAEINTERAKTLALKEERGVEITRVEEDGPAAKAGVKVGDVVLTYNGTPVEGTEQFMRLVRETPAGREVKLGLSRGGSPQSISVRTATRKGGSFRAGDGFFFEMPNFPEIRIPDVPKAYLGWRSARLGIEGESLEGQLAGFFGVDEGVLVRSVIKGSAAERAGIRAGDVILKVNEQKVTSTREISAALSEARSGAKRSVPVMVMRDKKQVSVTVTLDDEKGEQPGTARSVAHRI
jgi:serine protease Do